MSNEPIEGEPSHLEAISIFFPSMLTLDVSSEPISKPILDPNDSLYALFPESYDNPRNMPRHPKHRSHESHKEDQEEQQQWLEDIKNLCAIAIEWMDEVLDKINRELPIHGKPWTTKSPINVIGME
jgi:hypothetical protein